MLMDFKLSYPISTQSFPGAPTWSIVNLAVLEANSRCDAFKRVGVHTAEAF